MRSHCSGKIQRGARVLDITPKSMCGETQRPEKAEPTAPKCTEPQPNSSPKFKINAQISSAEKILCPIHNRYRVPIRDRMSTAPKPKVPDFRAIFGFDFETGREPDTDSI